MQNTTPSGLSRTRPWPRWAPRPPSLRRASSARPASTLPAVEEDVSSTRDRAAATRPGCLPPATGASRVAPEAPADRRRPVAHQPGPDPRGAAVGLDAQPMGLAPAQGVVHVHELTLPASDGAEHQVQVTFTFVALTENEAASHKVHVISLVDREGQEWDVPPAQRDEFATDLLVSFLEARTRAASPLPAGGKEGAGPDAGVLGSAASRRLPRGRTL